MATKGLNERFETEILRNLTKIYGDISNVTKQALEEKCLFYSLEKCIEANDILGGYLSDDLRDQIIDEVCAVFDKHFSSRYDKGFCRFMFFCYMRNMNNARREVMNYHHRCRKL